jgi:hypothetical protein
MDAQYLNANVGSVLSAALTSAVLQTPADPIAFLSAYLRNHVQNNQKFSAAQADTAKLIEEDNKREKEAQEETELLQKRSVQIESTQSQRLANIEQFIRNYPAGITIHSNEPVRALFEQFISSISSYINVPSVYVGEVDSADSLHYIAATPSDNFLVNTRLNREKSVTLNLFNQEEGEETQEEEEEGSEKKAKSTDLPALFIPNVLIGPYSRRIYFHRKIPKLGSYYAVRLSYDSYLTEESLEDGILQAKELSEQRRAEVEAKEATEQEELEELQRLEDEDAEAEEDDEEAQQRNGRRLELKANKEREEKQRSAETEQERAAREAKLASEQAENEEAYLLSKIKRGKKNFVLGIDTLQQSKRLTDGEIALIQRLSQLLVQSLALVDKKLARVERQNRENYIKNVREVVESEENANDDDRAEQLQRAAEELEKNNLSKTDADIAVQARIISILGNKQIFSQQKEFVVPKGPLNVLQAVFYLLDYDREKIVDFEGKPSWVSMKSLINEELFSKISSFRPREQAKWADLIAHENQSKLQRGDEKTQYASAANLSKLLEGTDPEELKERNFLLYDYYELVQETAALREAAKEERRVQREEEEAAEAERKETEEETKRLKAEEEEEEEKQRLQQVEEDEDEDN